MTNICFDCEKAVGGCPWSSDFTPVPGWTAKPVTRKRWTKERRKSVRRSFDTYHITACPLFEQTEPRKSVEYDWWRTMFLESREN